MDPQDWLDLCERTHRDVNQLSADVSQKNKGAQIMSSFQKRKYNTKLNNYQNKIKRLETELNKHAQRTLGAGEVRRRQDLINDIKRIQHYVEGALSDEARARAITNHLHGDKNRYKENERTEGRNQSQLLQQQEDQYSNQDAKLDMLLDGVTNLKAISNDVGKEINLHANLLDDIDDRMDSNDARLAASTHNVEQLEEQTTSCWTYLLIVFLFIVIIFLAFTNQACIVFNPSRC